MRCRMRQVRRTIAAGFTAALAAAATAQTVELDTAPEGRYAVACSNVEQDYSLAVGSVSSYWTGTRSQRSRYVTELLIDPQLAVRFTVRPPNDRSLFANRRNQDVDFVALVCYPTTDDNPRAPFWLPDGRHVPAMQRGNEAPILNQSCDDGPQRCTDGLPQWPLLVYSHGLGGSPLSGSYLETIVRFASHGYIVAAPFHADPRFSRISLDDLGDLRFLLQSYDEVVEMRAIRPLAIRDMIDWLLGHPDYSEHIDRNRIAGFGASLGGETMLLLAGAEISYKLDASRKQVVHDPRLGAIVTIVPYSGISALPSFGNNQRGVRDIGIPYLGIAGTDDRVAPLSMTKEAVERLQGTRFLIAIDGMGHGSQPDALEDAYGWYLPFLDANLNGDRSALSRLYRATNVRDGADDFVAIAHQSAVPPRPGETVAREFHHPGLNHFFLTATQAETNLLLDNPDWGWMPTGHGFVAHPADSTDAGVHPVCRFYGDPFIGPNSHFFTASPVECQWLIDLERQTPPGEPAWRLEGLAFAIARPTPGGNCPEDAPFPIWRAYNGHVGEIIDGIRRDANHRYASDPRVFSEEASQGWQIEGVAFCSAASIRVPEPAGPGTDAEAAAHTNGIE